MVVKVVDPLANPHQAEPECGVRLADPASLPPAHSLLLAAPPGVFVHEPERHDFGTLVEAGVVVVMARLPVRVRVWAL